jgi:O-succinylbenzoic acid--CoA ligase
VTRPLVTLAADPLAVLHALRDALSGSGPAILAYPSDAPAPAGVPAEVPRRVALVVETSGSTARPKRVALSADALLASAAASDSVLGGAGQWLLALPAHYIAGLNVLVRSIASATEPVLLSGGSFDPLAFANAASSMDAALRYAALVPAQLGRLLDTPESHSTLRRFDGILVGGQSTPAPLAARAADLGIRLIRTYGSSETSGGCVYDGVPIGNTEVRVTDGHVELAGSVLADGYLDDPERTEAAFAEEAGKRWYRTGDTGVVSDGVLRVTGRIDDVIISGGLKVSLADVERVVRGIPGQHDAVVVAAASERWGEVPVVVTTVSIERSELRAIVASELSAAASPDRVVVLEALPLLASGKPDRRLLRSLAQ